MMNRTWGATCVLLGVILSPAWAQERAAAPAEGRIAGRVTDATGASLPGVAVEVRTRGGGALQTAATDGAGDYRIEGLAAGTWDLSFHLPNFASASYAVAVRAGEDTRLDTTLALQLTAQVLVTAVATFRDLSAAGDGADLIGIANTASSGVVPGSRLEDRPVARPGDLAERVPGLVISQHSGEGKANQYYVRGFNIDHGTDLALTVAGLPVNLPTHGHGQGYADLNFLIPELVGGIQFKKGPYFAEEGDFSAAGAIHMNYLNVLERPLAKVELGQDGFRRALLAASPPVADGHLLLALELGANDGPWVRPDGFRKVNGVLRYSRGTAQSGVSVTGFFYDAEWDATDQVPTRAIESGDIPRFGLVDPTTGGRSHRHSVVAAWQSSDARSLTRVEGFASLYGLDLFSNFTYFLTDPENGDQFEQRDDRWLVGARASRLWRLGRATRPTELAVGAQARYDDIAPVGLYLTAARQRLSTVREDEVRQTSGALHAQVNTQWAEKFRTVIGLRGDVYRFDVNAMDPLNSGTDSAGRLSPKISFALGPWARSEVYVNYGWGFHSNDARGATITRDPVTGDPAERVDPLVRARGAEVGLRTLAIRGLHVTAALWGLDIDSELLFVGDAGTTEASRPSQRRGVELAAEYTPHRRLALDASYAYSRARFADEDPAGDCIPGAIEGVFAAGLSVKEAGRWSGSLRARWFGPRPLIEDNSVRSRASTLFHGDLSFRLRPGLALQASVFNVFGAEVADVDYFYTSRLPGEPSEGIDDIHTHPSPPRTFRLGLLVAF